MDVKFNQLDISLTVSLSEADCLAILNNEKLKDSVSINSTDMAVSVQAMKKRVEQFRPSIPIGDDRHVQALGYKSSTVAVGTENIDIVIPRTLIAANVYPAERVPFYEVRQPEGIPRIGDVIIRFADLQAPPSEETTSPRDEVV